MELWLLFIWARLIDVSYSCDYYFEGPIHTALDQRLGDIVLGEIIEISFQLKIEELCPIDWCSLFRIYNPINSPNARLPWFNIPANDGQHLKIIFSDAISKNSAFEYKESILTNTFQDGLFHSYHSKFSYNQRVFIYDGIVLKNDTSQIWDHTQRVNKPFGIYTVENNHGNPLINATLKDICINNSWYSDTDQSQCDYYWRQPMNISNGNFIGNITFQGTMEISFDLQIERDWTCPHGVCGIFKIGKAADLYPVFPLFALKSDGSFEIEIGDEFDKWITSAHSTHFGATINNGEYHRIYFRFNSTKRILIYDYSYTMLEENGDYSVFSQYLDKDLAVFVTSNHNFHGSTKGYVKNFCIRSYHPTSYPTIDPTSDPTSSSTNVPTYRYTDEPTSNPTSAPTNNPTPLPTIDPTETPVMKPTTFPTQYPTMDPTPIPTNYPTTDPTHYPSSIETSTYGTILPTLIDATLKDNPTMHPTASTLNSLQKSDTVSLTNNINPTPSSLYIFVPKGTKKPFRSFDLTTLSQCILWQIHPRIFIPKL